MFTKVLTKDASASLAALGESGILKDAYLAGGTALALQIGHRISIDFDFFTQMKFDPTQIVQQLAAIGDRGIKRDFIDLYFIVEVQKYLSLGAIFQLYDKKFAVLHQNKLHLLKALMYFDDAADDHMPEMLHSVSWEEVKAFFNREIPKFARELLRLDE